MESELESSLQPGTLVWAKYARYPLWPAVVVHERELAFIRGVLPQLRPGSVLVRFLHDGDYAAVPRAQLQLYGDVKPNRSSRTPSVRGAVDAATLWIQRYGAGPSADVKTADADANTAPNTPASLSPTPPSPPPTDGVAVTSAVPVDPRATTTEE